ncbi:MAG: hypothetical protein KME04_02695 [Pleurocapsa minor GSE-CHR-MK-17-07R]|jgi:hypothetical protein|nr:hypothetical protein [Pleurocapsa minor GSE-CHR-MK 17-07R]
MTSEAGAVVRPKRSRARRIFIGFALVAWFLILLVPCVCFVLVSSQEIIIPQGDLPGQHIRIWLIMEADERGLGVSNASIIGRTDTAFCEQTDNRFLLWQGRAPGVSYCECYERASAEASWELVSTTADVCPPA